MTSVMVSLSNQSPLWQREVRRDFIINVFILMILLVTYKIVFHLTKLFYTF